MPKASTSNVTKPQSHPQAPPPRPKSKSKPKAPAPPSLSLNQLVHEYQIFLDITIHTLLYTRQIYPSSSFVRRCHAWGGEDVQAQMSRYEGVRGFVGKAVEGLLKEVVKNQASRIILVLLQDRETPLERWVFGFERLLGLGVGWEEGGRKGDQVIQGGPTSHSLGVLFREIFIHIVTIAGTLGRLELDAESSFTLLLEQPSPSPAAPDSHTLLTDSASLQRQRQLYDAFMPAPDSFSSEGIRTAHAEGGEGEEDVKVKWLKEITTGVLDMEVVVQQLPGGTGLKKIDLKGKASAQ
ncbi:hypothetical protein BDY24DRAFT_411339 [Mrakia frigida]|uniref:uncharacterized protein n=1 Tax=Mrakia frigida TaxID=29902 RepID=UPI003FCC1CAD